MKWVVIVTVGLDERNLYDHLGGGLAAPAQTSKYTEDDQQGARRERSTERVHDSTTRQRTEENTGNNGWD